MDLQISEKRALVLGASRGLGRAIATALAAEGCNVVVGARDHEALTGLARELSDKYGVEAAPIAIDMSDASGVEDLAHRIENEFRLDILINNSGILRYEPI